MNLTSLQRSSFAALLLIIAIGGVSALVLFSQTIPPVTVPPGTAVITNNCATTVQEGTVTPTTGTLLFDCGGTTTKLVAFSVTTAGAITPTFTLTTGYTSLSISTTGSCTGASTITSGIQALLVTGGYVYCANYSVASTGGTLASFTVTWNQ